VEYLIIYEATPRVSMATKSAKCITDGKKKKNEIQNEVEIGSGQFELYEHNEIAVFDCKST